MLQDFLLQSSLPPEWNGLVQYVRHTTEPDEEDWDKFRNLFMISSGIREHQTWWFLRKLFV